MLAPSALLYYLSAPTFSDPILIHNFTGLNAVYGITEYSPDVFVVVAGTFSRSWTERNATGEVWTVNLTNFEVGESLTDNYGVHVSSLANITDVGFLNGAATWGDYVLIADSSGVVYSVDTQTGKYSITLNDTTMAPNMTGLVKLGVNGLRTVNNSLYFTNTNYRSVHKVALNENATAAGPYYTLASDILLDDLEVDPSDGSIFLPGLAGNIITYLAANGTARVIEGALNSTDVPGPTSLRFARRMGGELTNFGKLLVSTSGGIEYPINGSYIMGGGLYELEIKT